jgi:hypothetical protein
MKFYAMHFCRRFFLSPFFVAILLVAGCGSAQVHDDLAVTNWQNTIADLNCEGMNRGIEVLGVKFSDMRARSVRDAYVWVDCYHDTSPWPHQLEVYDGSSSPSNPRQLAVLISANEHVLIRSVALAPSSLVVDIARYADQDAACCPTITERRIFKWDGARLVRQRAS